MTKGNKKAGESSLGDWNYLWATAALFAHCDGIFFFFFRLGGSSANSIEASNL